MCLGTRKKTTTHHPPMLQGFHTVSILIATITLVVIILHSKLHFILTATLFQPATTPLWRVETLYPTVLRLLASAITTIILMRVLGLLCVAVFHGFASKRKTASRPTPIFYVYPRVRRHRPTQDDAQCTVCLSEGCDTALPCGHLFHWACVRPWLDAKNACPLCKRAQVRRGVDGMGRVVV